VRGRGALPFFASVAGEGARAYAPSTKP
jgi:hypothetical protein